MDMARLHSVSLLPTPLAGTTNPLAPIWSSAVTPRGENGATNLTPIWALALDANGTAGRQREAIGTYFGADNVAACSTNFAACSIVAGDAQNWSNYVFSARCIPTDHDGFGLLLRYQNPTNWYRIAFRQQDSLLGAKKGMSVQKCVNGLFDQVVSDTRSRLHEVTPSAFGNASRGCYACGLIHHDSPTIGFAVRDHVSRLGDPCSGRRD